MTSTVIVTVVIVLGIIIAGGFLIYFIGDLFMSLASHGKKDDELIKNKTKRDKQKINEYLMENFPDDAERIKKDPDYSAALLSGGKVESYNPEDEQEEAIAEENIEEPVEEVEEPVVEEPVVEDTVEEQPAETTETIDNEEAERIAKRRQEILDRISRLSQSMNEDEEDEENEEENEEESEEVDLTEETTEESVENNQEETVDTVDSNEEEISENSDESQDSTDSVVGYTVEELQEIIANEKDELKANEKELRKCKKEFIPLRKVKRTLENDEKKLRRREALVAKQKVELYGVNNIADIDQEKAQKLSEDLDLLDGLKLSVEHCQEVMNKNQERYPLLEQIFNLLTSRNAELKASIANHEKMLEKLNADTTDTEE